MESSGVSRIKTETPLRFGRPMKKKDVLVKCPKCYVMGANLWECEMCHTEYGSQIELVPASVLQADFVPNFIKTELPPVPDDGDDDQEKGTECVLSRSRKDSLQEQVLQEGQKESSTTNEVDDVTTKESLDDAPRDYSTVPEPGNVLHCDTLEKERQRLSSPNISTTSDSNPLPALSSTTTKRRTSTNSNSSTSSYTAGKERSHQRKKKSYGQVNVEKRVRIFQLQQTASKSLDKSVLNSAPHPIYNNEKCRLDALVDIEDAVIEETRVNDKAKVVRILRCPLRGLDVALKDKEYPVDVEKVIFGGPCSLQVVQQILLFFKSATAIRFGQSSLNVSEDEREPKLDRSKLKNKKIKSFELAFDRKLYNKSRQTEKETVIYKILAVLKMAEECYVNLEECNITIPHTSEMDRALEKFVSRFHSKGQKIIEYGQKIIQYSVHGARSKNNHDDPPSPSGKDSYERSVGQSSSNRKAPVASSSATLQFQNHETVSNIASTVISSSVDTSESMMDIFNVQVKTEATSSSAGKSPNIDTIELSSDEDEIVLEESKSFLQQKHSRANNSLKNKREREEVAPIFWNNNSSSVPGYAAACPKCGYMSEDVNQCEKCKTLFTTKVSIQPVKRRKIEAAETYYQGTESMHRNQSTDRNRSGIATSVSGIPSTIVECKAVRVGDYEASLCTPHLAKNLVVVSADGISFKVPHRIDKTLVNCSIPISSLDCVAAHFGMKLPILVIKTTERFAEIIRSTVGLSEVKRGGNYYSFDKGDACQRMIMIHFHSLAPLSVARIKEILGEKLNQIPYERVQKLLDDATCKCCRKK